MFNSDSKRIQLKAYEQFIQTGESLLRAAVLKTSPCVVGIVSRGVIDETVSDLMRRRLKRANFGGSDETASQWKISVPGTIIECDNAGRGKFSSTIVTTASLLVPTNGVQPSDIEVEVHLANGDSYEGSILACDSRNNLAVVIIESDTPLQTANLRDLDDIVSIQGDDSRSSQLLRHSSSFKIFPGDMIASLSRNGSSGIDVTYGRFRYPCLPANSMDCRNGGCKVLYPFETKQKPQIGLAARIHREVTPGPVISCHGEVIGFIVSGGNFLPSNIVSRWWNYYKQHKKLCQPCLGVNVANLHAASLSFLEKFVRNFPTVSSGVIVAEVQESAACSGLRKGDVIVKCNGTTVRSTLDLFDKICSKVGTSVELSVLRLKRADHLNLTVTVNGHTED